MHDQLVTSCKICVLTAVDAFLRYAPVLDARFRYKGEDSVATLDTVCQRIVNPKTIGVDSGGEFISRDMD